MRTIITACLAILLLSAFANAHLRTLAAVAPAGPSTKDVETFLSGLWESIGLGHDFDDFAACIQVDSRAGAQLQKAMTLMNSSSASDVSNGLNKLDKVVFPLLAGIKACQMKDKYSKTVKQIVDKFTNPSKLAVETGSSILVNGVEVYADIAAAIKSCDKDEFFNCGDSVGDAMGKVYFSQENVTSADEVAKINAIPNITWTAADITEFKGVNRWQFKKARVTLRRKKNMPTVIDDESVVDEETKRNLAVIPTAFDSRTKWPGCVQAIRDQQGCGSCWAFAASQVLSDRFCIVSNKTINKVMSPQYLLSCDTTSYGCNGGIPYYSWKFLENTGDVSDTCSPYKSGNGVVPSCSTFTKCADNTPMRKYYAKRNSTKLFSNATAIQNEIMTNGPVEAGMDVFSDFFSYRSGIYYNTPGAEYMGGHAVKIIGWGTTNGIKYWIVANSWGTYWGDSGFFKIRFGSCYIDSGVFSGIPDLTRS